ncbi:MAG: long-chain fatty acid--CoA ligase [Microbacterium sp.]
MEECTVTARGRLGQLLRHGPADAHAIHFAGEWTTWGDLARLARELDALLDAEGLGESSRIGVILENRPEHVGTVVALIASGRTIVSLSPLQPDDRLISDVRACRLPAVIASPESLARPGVRAAVEECGVVVELRADLTVARAGGAVATDEVSAEGTVLEMLTSGTTGPPKRVRIGPVQLEKSLNAGGPAPAPDRLLRSGTSVVYTPLVHISGMWGSVAPLYAGRRIALLPRFSLGPWLEAIETHRPRTSSAVPAVIRAILEADVPPERLASLKAVTSGTAPCPPELVGAMLDKYGIRVLTTYGATEFAGAVAAWTYDLHREWWDRKVGSTGRAMRGVELRIVDPDTDEVRAPGEPGILEVRAAQSVRGADEWVRTSDLARIDEDGFLFIDGRADDVIIRGGFKVHPGQVAAVLQKHPAVAAAGVAALTHPRLGSVPVAAVEVVPGAPRPTAAELDALARESLLPYEVPAHIAIVDGLPRTPSMKISRVELLDLVRADMDGAQASREDVQAPAV